MIFNHRYGEIGRTLIPSQQTTLGRKRTTAFGQRGKMVRYAYKNPPNQVVRYPEFNRRDHRGKYGEIAENFHRTAQRFSRLHFSVYSALNQWLTFIISLMRCTMRIHKNCHVPKIPKKFTQRDVVNEQRLYVNGLKRISAVSCQLIADSLKHLFDFKL